MRHSIACLLIAFFLFHGQKSYAQAGQNETVKDFKAKLLAEWNSLVQRINTVEFQVTKEYFGTRGNRKNLKLHSVNLMKRAVDRSAGWLWRTDIRYLNTDENKKQRTRRRKNRRISLSITNERYRAELEGSKGGSGWVVPELKINEKPLSEQFRRQRYYCPWLTLGNMELLQWLPKDGFAFTRVEPLPGHLLRAHFVYEGSEGSFPDAIKSGYFDLDAGNSYRPTSFYYELRMAEYYEPGSKFWGKTVYKEAGGIPAPKLMTFEEVTRSKIKGLLFGKEIHTFEYVRYNQHVPAEQFRLSFYGLPEPQGVVWRDGSNWYLWFIGIGVACLLIGAYFKYRLNRRKKLLAGE